jgi:CDP-diacylglycerol pyrophosphatase
VRLCGLALIGLIWSLAAHTLLALQQGITSRDALRHIVQEQCLPRWLHRHDPAPCVQISAADLSKGANGYAVLPDRKGGAHFLLIPIQTLRGIEDPRILQPNSANYFASAWTARTQLDAAVGQSVSRDAAGLAVNSELRRGQDQLHIHIECLQPRLYQALLSAAPNISDRWSAMRIDGSPYEVMRIMGEELGESDPFKLLARHLAAGSMGAYTLVVAGTQFQEGPGFIVLAGHTAPLGRDPPAQWARPGETLLDASCALAR